MIKEGRGRPVSAQVGGDQRKEARWPWCRSPDKASVNEESRTEKEFLCSHFYDIFVRRGHFISNKCDRCCMNIG